MNTHTNGAPSSELETRITERRAELIAKLVAMKPDMRLETILVRDKLKARLSELSRIIKTGVVDGWAKLDEIVVHRFDRWLADTADQLAPRESEIVAMIRPLHDRVVVKRVAGDSKTPGGVLVPERARERSLEAIVIAIGSGTRLADGTIEPLAVQPGDRILVARHAGADVDLVGSDHMIVRGDDILAVVDDGRS